MHLSSFSPFTHTFPNFDQFHLLFHPSSHHPPPLFFSFSPYLILFCPLSPSSVESVRWSFRIVTLTIWVILIFLDSFVNVMGDCYNFPKIIQCDDLHNVGGSKSSEMNYPSMIITLTIYIMVSIIEVEFFILFLITF